MAQTIFLLIINKLKPIYHFTDKVFFPHMKYNRVTA